MKRVFVLLLIFICTNSYAQTTPPENGVAMDASRSESTPTSGFTGIPPITFPLITYSHRTGISANVSLDYYAGGIKTDEPSTFAGVGWSLNAGGVITRTVRGIADDCPGKGFLYSSPIPVDPRDSTYKYYHNCLDGELDVFQFNFEGHSGKFYIGKDTQIIMTPLSKIKIDFYRNPVTSIRNDSLWGTIDHFIITTETGAKFIFSEKEKQNMYVLTDSASEYITGNLNYTSAWYLSKIVSYSIQDSINFEYITLPSRSVILDSQSVRFIGGTSTHSDSIPPEFIANDAKALSKILLPDGKKILFLYTDPDQYLYGTYPVIKRIKMYDPDFLYGYMFNWDTLNLSGEYNRPFLKGFDWYDTAFKRKGNEFTYNTPMYANPYLNSRDHWGYYNGINNHLEYVPTVPGKYTGANREADTLAKAGTLASIKDAKGGITYYDFENNDRYPYKDSLNSLSINLFTSTSNTILLQRIVGKKTFFKILNSRIYGGGYPAPITGPGELIVSITNLSSTVTYFTKTLDLYQLFYTGITSFWCELPTGSYLLKTQVGSGTSVSGTYTNKVTWYTQSDSTGNFILSGGIRIKRIRHFDSYTGKSDTLATYKYITESGKSSGFMGIKPIYDYTLANTSTTRFISSLPINNNDYSEGSNVGYSRVELIKGSEARNIGKEVTIYSDLDDDDFDNSPPEYPFAPRVNKTYTQGLVKKKILFDNVGNVIGVTKNTYSKVEVSHADSNFCSYKTILSVYPGGLHQTNPQYYIGKKYYPLVGLSQLSVTQDTLFHKDSSITVRSQIMEYDSNLNLKKIITPYDLNKGLSLEKRFYYPYNYILGGAIGKLRDSSIYIPISTEVWIMGDSFPRVLSISVKDYDVNFGSSVHLIRPTKLYSLETNVPIPQSIIGGFDSSVLVRDTVRIKYQRRNYFGGNNDVIHRTVNVQSQIAEGFIYDNSYSNIIAQVANGPNPKADTTSRTSIDAKPNAAYTSFEPGADQGGFSTYQTTTYPSSITGDYSCWIDGGYIFAENLDSSLTYMISYWTTGSISVSNSSSPFSTDYRAGWTLYTHTMSHKDTVRLSGTGLIDELRLYPINSQMTTSTYNVMEQVSSLTDANNTIVYNEYDSVYRLKVTRDKDKNVIKKYEYSDSLIRINFAQNWQALDSTFWICEEGGTGNVLRKEVDSNYNSESYLSHRYVYNHFDTTRCPLAPCIDAPNIKRIGLICETACKVTTEALYDYFLDTWVCTYHYVWSDSSISDDYYEYSAIPCSIGTECP